jgi:hypothetical protein
MMDTRTHVKYVEDEPVLDEQWFIFGTLTITFIRDRNADCDADGNRGRDVTYEDERVWVLTKAVKAGVSYFGAIHTKDLPAKVVAAAQAWADAYVPNDTGEEDEGPDRDV